MPEAARAVDLAIELEGDVAPRVAQRATSLVAVVLREASGEKRLMNETGRWPVPHDDCEDLFGGPVGVLRMPVDADQVGVAIGALIRQLFTAADGTEARQRLADAISQLEPRLPKIARLLEDAEDDVLAFYAFPSEHWPKLRSTNPLERFNREIGRRTDVVGIFPDDASVIRLVSMLAIEANDEWLVGRSYISRGSMATLYERQTDGSLSSRSEQEVAELAAA